MFKQVAFSVVSSAGTLPGVFHHAENKTAVIFVNGGAQTRVGPHRMYVNLAYKLQRNGFSSFRFDLPGYGDASGNALDFFDIGPLLHQVGLEVINAYPHVEKLVYFGLCDGATAILLSNPATLNKCHGIFLVNPWARQPKTHAKTLFKHYYFKKMISLDSWKKFFLGSFNCFEFLKDIKGLVLNVAFIRRSSESTLITPNNYLDYCWKNWNKFAGSSFLFIAGADLTALEFLEAAKNSPCARESISKSVVITNDNADHTFSSETMQYWLQDEFLKIMTTSFN